MSLFHDNTTQIIAQDITLTSDERVGLNVTLIFQGGKILGTGNLTGNHTKIIAPACQIFSSGVTVDGTWDIDCAYPQWFGAEAKDKSVFSDNTANGWESSTDCSDAINKAIKMKGVGEVFLPCGYYKISNPIIIPIGIQLNGVKGMSLLTDSLLNDSPSRNAREYGDDMAMYDGTILVADNFINHLSGAETYMVYVNTKIDNNQLQVMSRGHFLAGQVTGISNICFKRKNWSDNDNIMESPSYSPNCIYSATSININNVRFEDFIQAVCINSNDALGKTYYDVKSIINCDYAFYDTIENYNVQPNEIKYAFDLGYLGDALIFEHNAIHQGKYNKGVKVRSCHGGRISSNIINADVEIKDCKALSFNNNHMEGGHVIKVDRSCVSMESNYIERGYNIPFVFSSEDQNDKTIVSMNNDVIVFMDIPRNYNEGDEETEGVVNYPTLFNRFSNDSEYDIKIDKSIVLNIAHLYRYRIGDLPQKLYPMGIKICKSDDTPLKDFNDFSYMLSQNSIICCGYNVDKNFTINNINSLHLYSAAKNDGIYWLAADGIYHYKYQVIYDKQRRLLATRNNSQLFVVSNSPSMYEDNGLMHYSSGGVFLIISDDDGNSARGTIRLFRRRGNSWDSGSDFQYVDIPNTNNYFLCDNGISVNGYHWMPATTNDILTGALGIESITYQGYNVVCRLSGNDANSMWQHGDVLVKTGTNPTIELK